MNVHNSLYARSRVINLNNIFHMYGYGYICFGILCKIFGVNWKVTIVFALIACYPRLQHAVILLNFLYSNYFLWVNFRIIKIKFILIFWYSAINWRHTVQQIYYFYFIFGIPYHIINGDSWDLAHIEFFYRYRALLIYFSIVFFSWNAQWTTS